MTTFLDEIARILNFLPVLFLALSLLFFLFLPLSRARALRLFFFSVMVESVCEEERRTDSSVGWLNYNKNGRICAAKCRCMEEKKEEEEEEKSF